MLNMMTANHIALPSIILTDRDLACMNAVDAVFPTVPSLVCRWHMNRNVLAKTRSIFGQIQVENPLPKQDKFVNTVATDQFMQLYYNAVDAPTEAEFDAKCEVIREASSEMADYLDLQWWEYKTKLVRCWTNQYLHFGYRDTSPVEGTHSKCKKWLESSRGDLLTAFKKLLPWCEASIQNVKSNLEKDVTVISNILQKPQYSGVVMFIGRTALDSTAEFWKQGEKIVKNKEVVKPCTGVFRRTNGSPCLHDIIELINSDFQKKLRVDHFHRFWLTRRGHTEECGARPLEPAPLKPTKTAKRRKKHTQKSR